MDPWHIYTLARWNGSIVDLQLGQMERIHCRSTIGAGGINPRHTTVGASGIMDTWQIYSWGGLNGVMLNLQQG